MADEKMKNFGQIVSDKKLEANRRNSKQSTGPRTSAGKKNSSRNARKHSLVVSSHTLRNAELRGMKAQDILVAGEEEAEFLKLWTALKKKYNPSDEVEQQLVTMLLMCFWRMRRVWHWHRESTERESTALRASAFGVALEDEDLQELLVTNPERARIAIQVHLVSARSLRADIASNGILSTAGRELLGTLPRKVSMDVGWMLGLAEKDRIFRFSRGSAAKEGETKTDNFVGNMKDGPTPEELTQGALKRLDNFLSQLEHFQVVLQYGSRKEQHTNSRPSLPDLDELEKVSRYETALIRHIERVIGLLEDLRTVRALSGAVSTRLTREN